MRSNDGTTLDLTASTSTGGEAVNGAVQRAVREHPHGAYVEHDVTSVCNYVEALFGEKALDAKEIGDGNLNLVFRVHTDQRSLIVKQAVPYMRLAGEGWPL